MKRAFGSVWLGIIPILCALGVASSAAAQERYPVRPIRVVMPFGAGGLGDVMTRLITEKVSERIGQRFLIENNPGAGGITAGRAVVQAPPDGYTLAYVSNATAISASLFRSLPYDPLKDFTPIASMGTFDLIFLTARTSPYGTLADVAAAAKAAPGKINVGTIGVGSVQHLGAELLKSTMGLDVVIVPYRTSGEVLVALERNDIQLATEFFPSIKGGYEAGKFTILGTAGTKRTRYLPETPTMKEAGAGDLEVVGWNALFARVGTQPSSVELLNRAVNEVLATPEMADRLLALGVEPNGSMPADSAARLQREIRKWGVVIDRAGIERK